MSGKACAYIRCGLIEWWSGTDYQRQTKGFLVSSFLIVGLVLVMFPAAWLAWDFAHWGERENT